MGYPLVEALFVVGVFEVLAKLTINQIPVCIR